MIPEEAIKILGLPESATSAELSISLKIQQVKFEQNLAHAPTPDLQAKYREALRRLKEAYATLERLREESPLLTLRPDCIGPEGGSPTASANLKLTHDDGRGGEALQIKFPAAWPLKLHWAAAAAVLLFLAGLGGWFFTGRMHGAKSPGAPPAIKPSDGVHAPALSQVAAGGSMAGKSPYPTLTAPYENTLGMKFVPVAGTRVLFGIWDVRVQDFETFVNESRYDATNVMWTYLGGDGLLEHFGDTWRDPDFAQSPTHPVCGVSWQDAQAFCAWLTQKERREGKLNQLQNYRLPTDAEWSVAAGNTKYPWGDQWPPPAGAGNYASGEVAVGDWPTNLPTIQGYLDGYPRTAPVGSFPANRNGLYDMGGNVRQWCQDLYRKEMTSAALRKRYPELNDESGAVEHYRVLRGSSWASSDAETMLSSWRSQTFPGFRVDQLGFRCVLCNIAR